MPKLNTLKPETVRNICIGLGAIGLAVAFGALFSVLTAGFFTSFGVIAGLAFGGALGYMFYDVFIKASIKNWNTKTEEKYKFKNTIFIDLKPTIEKAATAIYQNLKPTKEEVATPPPSPTHRV